jgi:DNA topoisomerase-1
MASRKPKHLVIVESPVKKETIGKYLGSDYMVEATSGHVVDLPKKGLAVDVDNGYEPEYQTVRGKGKLIESLKKKAKQAEDILIATDPDREGEAIGFHIAQKLGYESDDGDRFHRVRFNELTESAVRKALANPSEIDVLQVDAQQARRILDRLVGYGLSPLLWRKISPVDPISRRPLSAGRVQSAVLKLLVDRERKRRRFRAGSWWDLKAQLAAEAQEFPARLSKLGGRQVVTGKNFDPDTGEISVDPTLVRLDEDAARALADRLETETFRVVAVSSKRGTQPPYPPFETSTLQGEASSKLGMRAKETMRVAQRLYEAGHITYMRTDSTRLSSQAISSARKRVEAEYGRDYLSSKPRGYSDQSGDAQDAHEAVRPSGTAMHTARDLNLTGREAALYDMIWKRTVASQMADVVRDTVTAKIMADDAEFTAVGRTTVFPGFLRAYVEGVDDPEAALENRDTYLPPLDEGMELDLRELAVEGHETRPPARYTENELLKILKKGGIGRPSTYAPTFATLQDRGYVNTDGKQLVPTFLAFAVTRLLEEHFSDLVDPGFTSRMEGDLDRIADGDVQWREFLDSFYRGPNGFENRLEIEGGQIDPREASTVTEFEDLRPSVRIGRYGNYLEVNDRDEPLRVTLPEGLAPADLTPEKAEALIVAKEKADEPLGDDPETGLPVRLLLGRYGPFVQLGEQEEGGEKPKRASLPKGVAPDDVDLDVALRLLSLPRVLGEHPEKGGEVLAGIGRFGPFVVHDGDFRSLLAEDDVYTVQLDRALELLAQPKAGRKRSAPKILRELGPHPVATVPT